MKLKINGLVIKYKWKPAQDGRTCTCCALSSLCHDVGHCDVDGKDGYFKVKWVKRED